MDRVKCIPVLRKRQKKCEVAVSMEKRPLICMKLTHWKMLPLWIQGGRKGCNLHAICGINFHRRQSKTQGSHYNAEWLVSPPTHCPISQLTAKSLMLHRWNVHSPLIANTVWYPDFSIYTYNTCDTLISAPNEKFDARQFLESSTENSLSTTGGLYHTRMLWHWAVEYTVFSDSPSNTVASD
jgi:hypothetical protein